MRHPATAFALVLALLSGFVLAQLWSLDPIRLRTIQAIPSEQVEATTLAFYQGVNDYLDDGNDSALRRTLHPKFVNHQPGGSTSANDKGFFQQLDSIRRFYPGIQIEPHVTPLSSSAASITLSWNTVARHDFAGIGIDPGDLVGRLDLLQIERGLIVERWSSAVLTGQLDPFLALSLELPIVLDTMVARVRQLPLQGDHEPNFSQFGHVLLIDLSGEAVLEVIHPSSMPAMVWKQHRGRVASSAAVELGRLSVTLGPMEAVFLPASTTFRMWDTGDQDAQLIALEFGPPVSSEIPTSGPLLADLRTTLWSGIKLKGVGNHLILSFGRAELLPEATLSSPEVGGIELIWVTDGTVDMAGSRGEARVRAASGLRSQLIEGHAVLRAGDAGAAGPGADVTYQVSGASSSTMWVFSLVAIPDPPITDAVGTLAGPTTTPTPPPLRNVS